MKAHVTQKKVPYIETTQLKAVYFSTFLQYFGLGIEEYLKSLGIPLTELIGREIFLGVVESFCQYKSFAECDDILEIHTKIKELKEKTINFESTIYRKDGHQLVASGYTIWVAYNKEKKAIKIPEEVMCLLEGSR